MVIAAPVALGLMQAATFSCGVPVFEKPAYLNSVELNKSTAEDGTVQQRSAVLTPDRIAGRSARDDLSITISYAGRPAHTREPLGSESRQSDIQIVATDRAREVTSPMPGGSGEAVLVKDLLNSAHGCTLP